MSFRVLLALGVVAVLWVLERVNERRRQYAKTLILDTRAIASFSYLREDLDCAQRLELRAIPNQRLASVFTIDNSFTTIDVGHHKEFLTRATQVIQRVDDAAGWKRTFDAGVKAMQRADAHVRLKKTQGQSCIPLARIVRIVTWMTILHVLFDVDPADLAMEDVVTATETINELWMQSKYCSYVLPVHQERLQSALHRMVPEHVGAREPGENPLNLIMPAYETMWRVVLLTFVSAAFRVSDKATMRLFRHVVQHVPECFGDSNEENKARAFAKEGLRLYPPTKRIYRGPPENAMRADIEGCHRDPITWGADALKFRPFRFLSKLTEAQKNAYIPFSTKPHICPAAHGFGERAIILLVAILARHLGTRESGARVRFGVQELNQNMDSVLPNSRDAAEGWVLIGR
ncbi:hypothetical protein SLS62_003952 [Diatrype stigma]|uniref:Cytochrome P450 n=1 Tax=Diatrype stigma TaxID=117547 RepID=A0AAN9UUA8_9PEZI